ncbi:MAG TPA: N-6 DNA methylase, partial [Gillisia sp.]|nr:N-6 DNA methylase [Gillisia sp.]
RRKDVLKMLDAQLKEYREWLLQLTICDPACGSGAFLNQALEFLMAEHSYVDELESQLLGYNLVFPDVENHILERNVYGVDINEESVEIARLSLWLRTAKKGRKLTSLSNNIKCGNSLIDEFKIAGELAFNWQQEFPRIFEKGGFDAIIGNPPYVGEKGHAKVFDDLKKVPKWKEFYRRRSNTYYFFIKHGIDLLRTGGFQSLIIPREFISADWSNKVRKSILEESKIEAVVDFMESKVFEDAGTSSLVLTQRKIFKVSDDYIFDLFSVKEKKLADLDFIINRNARKFTVSALDSTGEKPWNFYQIKFTQSKSIKPLGQLFDVSQGLVTGSDKVTNKHLVAGLAKEVQLGRGIFILREGVDIKHTGTETLLKINDNWKPLNQEEESLVKIYLKTEGLQKWVVKESNTYVIYVGSSRLKGRIKDYLLQFAPVLLNRSTTINDNETITLNEFESFTLDDIKTKYSSAGSVQKIMRRKRWWLPLYERESVPFDGSKILVNTKNMDRFTFSNEEHYSSGGGAGGQNYIYPKVGSKYFRQLPERISISDYVKFTNALLNSSVIQKYIKDGFYNQLSTAKIKNIPIIHISFSDKDQLKFYDSIVSNCNNLISINLEYHSLIESVLLFIKSKFPEEGWDGFFNWTEFDFKDFLAELKKKKVKLTLDEEAEWMAYFNKKKGDANALQAEINRMDKQIDKIVYGLYGLSDEEIEIVEQEK